MVRGRCILCKRESSVGVSLLQFPQDVDTRRRWAEFCRISFDAIEAKTRLCSLHFTPDCYKTAAKEGRRITLKKGVIPTLLRDAPVVGRKRRGCTKSGLSKNKENSPTTGGPLSQRNGNIEVNIRRSKKYKQGRGSLRRSCCICGNIDMTSPSLSSFRFPKNLEKRGEWLQSLGINETDMKDWYRVCSRHFPEGNKYSVPVRHVINTSLLDLEMKTNHRSSIQDMMSDLEVSAVVPEPTEENEVFPADCSNETLTASQQEPCSPIPENGEVCDDMFEVDFTTLHNPLVKNEVFTNEGDYMAQRASKQEPLCTSVHPSPVQENVELCGCSVADSISETYVSYVPHCSSVKNKAFTDQDETMVHTAPEQQPLCTPAQETVEHLDINGAGTTPVSSKRKFRYFLDFSPQDLETPRRKRRCLEMGRSQLSKYRKRIDALSVENRRIRSKITKLEDALTAMQRNGLITAIAAESLKVLIK